MKCLGFRHPTAAQAIAFLSEGSLNPKEEDALKEYFDNAELPDNLLIKDAGDLKKFLSQQLELGLPLDKTMKFLQALPDKLDSEKRVKGYENLLKITPVDFLNRDVLAYLITKTMDKDFWGNRVRNPENKKLFSERFGVAVATLLPELGAGEVSWDQAVNVVMDPSVTIEDEILALKHLLHLETQGKLDQAAFEKMELEAGTKEGFLAALRETLDSLA